MKAKPARATWPRVTAKKANGVKGWKIDPRRTGTNGKEHWRRTKEDALALAEQLATDYDKNGSEGLDMSLELRGYAIQGAAMLEPYGKTVLQACEFLRDHLKARQEAQNSALVSALAKEWHEDKASGKLKKLREDTLKGIKETRETLAEAFKDKRILDVSTADMRN